MVPMGMPFSPGRSCFFPSHECTDRAAVIDAVSIIARPVVSPAGSIANTYLGGACVLMSVLFVCVRK